MKKFLMILVMLFWCSNTFAITDHATCFGGECEFMLGLHYEWAETSCFQPLLMEEVETDFLSFTIVATGETCMVFDSR